jgi:hypothetical protein
VLSRWSNRVFEQLTGGLAAASCDLLPIATIGEGGLASFCKKDVVGTWELEPQDLLPARMSTEPP